MHSRSLFTALIATLFSSFLGLVGTASAQIEVIYTEISGDPSAQVPGAMDLTGNPVPTEFLSMLDVNCSPDGTQWILRGSTTQSADEANVLLLGVEDIGLVFAQEGQPVAGGVAGEVYDFFDGVAGFNDLGHYAFGARARGGLASEKEKVIKFDGTNYSIVAQESDLVTGLQDLPPAPAGDETLGNSLNSVHILNDGRVGFVGATISNVNFAYRPALFYDLAALAQSTATPIGATVWDGFDSNEFFTTPDGATWIAHGDTPTLDDLLAVNGTIAIAQGDALPGGVSVDGIFHTLLLGDGSWIARGDDENNDDWVIDNGVVLAQTGDPIMAGATELWGPVILYAIRTSSGDVIVGGSTDSADPDTDTVVVYSGAEILREGDSVDLDGNGAFDDDVFLRSFNADDAFVGADGYFYFLATLRNGVGDNLGDAFLRRAVVAIDDNIVRRGDCNDDGTINIADAVGLLAFLFPQGAPGALNCEDNCDANDDGTLNIADAVAVLAFLFPSGPPIPLPVPSPDCGVDPTMDALGCLSPSGCP